MNMERKVSPLPTLFENYEENFQAWASIYENVSGTMLKVYKAKKIVAKENTHDNFCLYILLIEEIAVT